MLPRPLLFIATLALTGCNRGQCQTQLRTRPGSDTAAAVAAAVDSVSRHWPGSSRWMRGWVATAVRRAGADTLLVEVEPRCWRGTDAPSATVRVKSSGRVVGLEEHLGG